MNAELSEDRIEEMIATAVHRGRRTRALRRTAAVVTSLGFVGALAVGGLTLLNTPIHVVPDVAVPPADTSPSTAGPTTAPPLAAADFLTSYTQEEQELILKQVAMTLEDQDPEGFVVVVSRTTHVDGLKALSPDVLITGADDTPAFILRISGPLEQQAVGRGAPGVDVNLQEVTGAYSLFGADGTGFSGAQLFEESEGPRATLPPISVDLEHDVALIDLSQVKLPPPPDTNMPALSDEEQAQADELLDVMQQLLPDGVEVDDVLSATPDGFVVDLRDGDGTSRAMLALWHLHPGVGSCPAETCTSVTVERGEVHVDTSFDSDVIRARHYTYRRPDDAAIYFTLQNLDTSDPTGQGTTHPALALSDEQVIDLLGDPAWTAPLDRKKTEPPQ